MTIKTVTIGICAPASGFEREKFLSSVKFLKSLGLKVVYNDSIFTQCGYLAGDDSLRARELNALFANPDVDVIMCARGGYGSSRIVDKLDKHHIRSAGKIFIGASDVCALMYELEKEATCEIYFGPFVTEMTPGMDSASLDLFKKIIIDGVTSHKVTGLHTLKKGRVEAEVTGGCLSIIQSTLMTPYETATDEKILFLEDVNEPLYKIDRMLTQLKRACKFKHIKGVMVGSFKGLDACTETFYTLLDDIFGDYNIPIVTEFPSGHGAKKHLIPFKKKVILDADEGTLEYLG